MINGPEYALKYEIFNSSGNSRVQAYYRDKREFTAFIHFFAGFILENKPLHVSTAFEHLTTCLRHPPPDTQRLFLTSLSASEWADACACAKQHGLAANLFHALNPYKQDVKMPTEIYADLQRVFFISAARNMRLYEELERLLHTLNLKNIPVVLLKGAHLAEAVYDNIALRDMVDIDLLIRDCDLEQTDDTLVGHGAHPHMKHRVKGLKGKHFTYSLPATNVYLEVHWDLFSGAVNTISAPQVWCRLTPLRIGSEKTWGFKPEDLIPYLCLHMADHMHDLRLRMIYDLDVVIRFQGDTLDWRQTVNTIKDWNGSAATYVFLSIASDFFKTPIPEDVLPALKPEGIEAAELARIAGIFKQGGQTTDESPPTPGISVWWETKGLNKKLKLALKRIIPPPETLATIYDIPVRSWRKYLYYPRYARDLLKGRVKALLHLMVGKRRMRGRARETSEIETLRRKLLHIS